MTSTLIRAAVLFGAAFAVWQGVAAQSCSVPHTLVTNEVVSLNTCDPSLGSMILCGAFESGPAAVYRVNIAYPGLLALEVTPGVGSSFNPAIFLTGRQCASGDCPRVADEAGAGGREQMNLDLDSGSYYIVVASDGACGSALVHLYERTLGGGLGNDGIFRVGFDY